MGKLEHQFILGANNNNVDTNPGSCISNHPSQYLDSHILRSKSSVDVSYYIAPDFNVPVNPLVDMVLAYTVWFANLQKFCGCRS